jgi:hypothetical protein
LGFGKAVSIGSKSTLKASGLIEDYCTSKNRRYMFYNIKAFF